MQQCGFCSMLSELLNRAMCGSGRRGSTDSYYKELGEQDTLKIEDKTSDSEDSSRNSPSIGGVTLDVEAEMNAEAGSPRACTGRFLTLHRRRRKRLVTRSLCREGALLDDLQARQTECMLEQSVQWRFNAFTLDNVSGGRSLPVLCVHLFQLYGLIAHFELDAARVWKLFSLLEEGYHGSNPYHNHVHAADVTQAMHCFLQQPPIRDYLEPLEIMASLIGSIAHDVDHPGVNQPFLIATSNHLASLYQNTSVLENHHWRWAMSCLAESGLTAHLGSARAQLARQISSLILATDITRQQEFLGQFKEYLDNNTMDMRRREHRHFVLQIALKCADISNPCRPWEISRKWSLKVCEEFFRQGDYERRLNLPVSALCDRHTNTIPKIQAGFYQFVVTPLVTQWHRFLQNSLSEQMLYNLNYNRSKWEQLLAKELAEETITEISDADIPEDDLDSCSPVISDSSEMLLPRRRSLVAARKLSIEVNPRRSSVPLNVLQDCQFKREKNSLQGSLGSRGYPGSSERSLHSQLSLGGHCEPSDEKKLLSSEKLLPDSSIASITTPTQATLLNSVLGKSGKLLRQQTFPPLETPFRPPATRGRSHEDTTKTEAGQTYLDPVKCKGRSILNKIMAQYELRKTEEDGSDVSVCTYDERCESGRRESAPVCSQLRDHLTALHAAALAREHRRKSVPAATEVVQFGKERKPLQLLSQTGAAGLAGARRRGSAPAAAGELRALLGGALRHSLNGGRRRLATEAPAACQWLMRGAYAERHCGFQRRSSLPVEVLTGT